MGQCAPTPNFNPFRRTLNRKPLHEEEPAELVSQEAQQAEQSSQTGGQGASAECVAKRTRRETRLSALSSPTGSTTNANTGAATSCVVTATPGAAAAGRLPNAFTDNMGRPFGLVDELSRVGFTDEDADVQRVFSENGACWAHHCCAAWSDGVIQAEDYSLLYVDKAVFNGLQQVSYFAISSVSPCD